jgi:hypothetical protein
VARQAVEEWLMYNDDILLGGWKRIGVGFDWGCPLEDARGVVLVVLFAGRGQGHWDA